MCDRLWTTEYHPIRSGQYLVTHSWGDVRLARYDVVSHRWDAKGVIAWMEKPQAYSKWNVQTVKDD